MIEVNKDTNTLIDSDQGKDYMLTFIVLYK